MKLIIRADDLGYTELYNEASFAVFSEGVATAADVMCDTPGSIDALKRLRDYPWISVGWHTHMWGTPLAEPILVPTLYDRETGHFRTDVLTAEDVDYDQALYECRMQMSMFHEYLGKAPDTVTMITDVDSPFCRAMRTVVKENGIAYRYYPIDGEFDGVKLDISKDEKWNRCKIESFLDMETMRGVFTDSISEQMEQYDPLDYYLNRSSKMFEGDKDRILLQCWHPGIVDYYVENLGDRTPRAKNFLLVRPRDLHALCSDEIKEWIVEKRIELVNQRDALYGTREYQNHLREIGSRLFFR